MRCQSSNPHSHEYGEPEWDPAHKATVRHCKAEDCAAFQRFQSDDAPYDRKAR